MKKGQIILIAAVAQNNVIGKTNALPWYLPEDLKRFKDITSGQTVLMGRKTFESIIERLDHPLPNRTNIIITKDNNYETPDGVELYHSIDEALSKHAHDNIYIIGGASIYAQTIDRADKLYITEIKKEYEGDVFFPPIDLEKWHETEREDHEEYSFVTYEKK